MFDKEKLPKPIDWKELDGEQVHVRVIRAEGLEQVYLLHKDAIYLVSESRWNQIGSTTSHETDAK